MAIGHWIQDGEITWQLALTDAHSCVILMDSFWVYKYA